MNREINIGVASERETVDAATGNSLTDLPAVAAVAAMREGDITAEHYAHALLDRAQVLESLNAFRTLNVEMVLEAARAADLARASGAALGMLHGLPIPVKDSVNTRALPTSNGTRALRDFKPRNDAAVLKPLFDQGAILMGKTNLHELSRGWTSNNGAFGAVRNPYDPDRIPGGSSGGSGVAVAARMAPLAIAEDTWGSIRVPAALCGIAGLRPSFGRYPCAGIMPLTADKFDQVGPLARSVGDLALFDAVVTGDATPLSVTPLSGVRIGISPDYFFAGLDTDVERIAMEALARLEAAGATLVWAEIPDAAQLAPRIAATIIGYENVAAIASFLETGTAGVSFPQLLAEMSPDILATYRQPAVTQNAYEWALQKRKQLQTAIGEYFEAHRIDVLAFPPVLVPAPLVGEDREIEIRGEKIPLGKVMGRNTALANCASLASLVLPAGLVSGGLPVGLEFDALPGRDRALLSLGLSLEGALGGIAAPGIEAQARYSIFSKVKS